MPSAPIESSADLGEDGVACQELFQDEDEMRRSLSRFCYGDLYVIGKIWIGALQSVLVGSKFCLVPVVKAERPPPVPPRPPLMKYTDLPIYTAPHYDYKTYQEDKIKCPGRNQKLIQGFLYPHVHYFRKNLKESVYEMKKEIVCIKNEIWAACCKKKKEFKCYMRHPDNLMVRQGAVVLGGATGYYIGRGNNTSKKIFFSTLGTLAAGALCFPKETDEAFRTGLLYIGKGTLSLYNAFCGKKYRLREKLPCEEDLPAPPKPRQVTKCPEKKK